MKLLNQKNICFVLILTLFYFKNSQAQTKVFSEAKGSRAADNKIYDYEKWFFSIGKDKYEINKSGRGKRMKENSSVSTFRFSIEDADYIDRIIYFAEYKNDLLLVGELSFGLDGGGFIIRLDGKTLKTKWRTDISALNIAQGLIEDNATYLAGVGFVSKISLETGKYIWKHDDLYRKYKESGAFNVFEIPKIEQNIITFTENQDMYKRPQNIIKFNKTDGKVIEVKVN
ncbi:MAG: hypothetical protein M3Q99_06270 [Acidobacteriota bacterium]|nr:hypothetical protein [Acidobacteriota bacterium]